MKPSEIKSILEETQVTPSKSLGQNFLCDVNIARWIVDQLDISEQDCVVEVGPGTGALTEHVMESAARKIILIEFDSRLAAYHKEAWQDDPRVEVHHADGAQWDTHGLYKEGPVKFLGNLPYSAGGAILSNFLNAPSPISRAVVMLQKEFIDRILAEAGEDAYGLLSLRIQANWLPKALKTVPPEAFIPRPRIDSTIMLLEPRPAGSLPVYDKKLLDELTRKSFAQRRKQMKKQLPSSPAWEEVAAQLKIPLTARAEELSLRQWVDLTRLYDTHPLADIAQKADEKLDVVNAQNEVVGQATRGEIHETHALHRAVHLFVHTKKGDLILQKRSHLKDKHPCVWDSSAAGHVDAGESYEEAAHRELAEELGIQEATLSLKAEFAPSEENGFEFVRLYEVEESAKPSKLHFPASEIEALEAFSLAEIQAWIARRPEDFASSFLQCFEAYLKAR